MKLFEALDINTSIPLDDIEIDDNMISASFTLDDKLYEIIAMKTICFPQKYMGPIDMQGNLVAMKAPQEILDGVKEKYGEDSKYWHIHIALAQHGENSYDPMSGAKNMGTGDEFKVFSVAAKFIKLLVDKKHPEMIIIMGEVGAGRDGLYKRFAQRIAKGLGKKIDQWVMNNFVFFNMIW